MVKDWNVEKFKDSEFGPGKGGNIGEICQSSRRLREATFASPSTAFDIIQEAHKNQETGKYQGETYVYDILEDMGINPHRDTISNVLSTPDLDAKWVIPELYLSAMQLGLRKSPIWSQLTASVTPVSAKTVYMPWINPADAMPSQVAELESIPLGNVSLGEKSFELKKYGRGISMSYEVMRYSTIDFVNIFFQEMGRNIGWGLDHLAISTLINGEQTDGSAAAPSVGVASANTLTYDDMLKLWVHLQSMGKNVSTHVMSEDIALEVLKLDEFRKREQGTSLAELDIQGITTPTRTPALLHPSVGADNILLVDVSNALYKFDAQPILIESEKAVSNQAWSTYATFITGFSKGVADSAVVLDKSSAFTSWGDYGLDYETVLNQTFS